MSRPRVPLLPRWWRWAGVVALAVAIFYFSVVASPPQGARQAFGPHWDKVVHAGVYAVLALATAYATANWREYPYRRVLAVLVVAVGYGVLVEFAQAPVAGRQFSVADMAANALGSTLAIGWFAVERRVRYRRVDPPVPTPSLGPDQ